MKKVLSVLLSLCMLLSITAGIDFSAMAAGTISLTTNVIEKYDYANEVVSKVNSERSKKSKSALKVDSNLTKYAMQRAAELAMLYSHTRPNGKNGIDIDSKVNGENINAGAKTATAVMDIWMNSKGHKENILRSSFKSIGVGCVEVNGYYFWVQLFGNSTGNGKKSTGTECANKTVNALEKNLFIYINTYNLVDAYQDQDYDIGYDGLDYEAVPNGYQVQINAADMTTDFYTGVTDAIVDKNMFTYKSSDSDVFTVSSTGLITIKKSGTATLTATLKSNKKFKVTQKINARKNSDIIISSSSFVYDGKAHKPTVSIFDLDGNSITDVLKIKYVTNCKSVGTHKIKIVNEEDFDYPFYDYNSYYTFDILPKGTSVSKASAKSKGFTVKWKKQSKQTTGYQIQYATNSKFTKNAKIITVSKNSTTSKDVKKLTGKKKYYVRIRTYKTVNGAKYYSAWSKAKTVTTKK